MFVHEAQRPIVVGARIPRHSVHVYWNTWDRNAIVETKGYAWNSMEFH